MTGSRLLIRTFSSPCASTCAASFQEAAEDLAHEAFLRVYTAPDFENIRSPRRYLFRIARNLALNAASEHDLAYKQTVDRRLFARRTTSGGGNPCAP